MDFRRQLQTLVSWLDLDELLNEETSQQFSEDSGVPEAPSTVRPLKEQVIIHPGIGGGCSQPVVIQPQQIRRTAQLIRDALESGL